MTDYYQTLGVSEGASPEEIKKAYRSLANKHHPDKGGDQAKFKDISVAYDTLSDAQKKAEYDHQRQFGNGQQFHFHTGNPFGGQPGFDPFGGIFGQQFPQGHPFGDIFGHMRRGQPQRNRDLNIQCTISFLDSYTGKQLEASYQLPSGKKQNVVISVPAGVNNGDTIRYQGLGDDSMPGPRGNLNVTILVQAEPGYERRGDDIFHAVDITPIEAMIGCRKHVKNLSGTVLDLDIRAGIEHGAEFASNGHGFPNVNNGYKGRFVTVIKIKPTPVTDSGIIQQLKDIDAKINQRN